jgi:gliding motility-associated-like protein
VQTGATTPTTVVELSGDYVLKAYNNWCASYDTVRVQLSPKPEQPFGTDSIVCFAYQSAGVKLNARNDSCSWIWQDGSQGSSYYVTSPGLYEVTITTPGGCEQTYSMNITEYCPGGIYIPNSFSPDGDGINDFWEFNGDRIGDFHVWLYDRWGTLVFETDDIHGKWGGESKARPGYVRNQTFTYRIEYNLLDEFDNRGPVKNIFGSLTVVR